MPIDSIIKITGTGDTALATSDVSAIDIPEDGLIVGVLGRVEATGMASDDQAAAELSFLSTHQFSANDARASIMDIALNSGVVTTSGQTQSSDEIFMSLPDGIPVAAGERIHMHTFGSAGVTPSGMFMLYLSFTPGTGRRAQRRR